VVNPPARPGSSRAGAVGPPPWRGAVAPPPPPSRLSQALAGVVALVTVGWIATQGPALKELLARSASSALVEAPAAGTEASPEASPQASPEASPGPLALWRVELDGAGTRSASASLAPVTGRDQTVEVWFDVDAVTRPTTLAELRSAPDWVAGVRLLLGEVGAWRLAANRWGLLEGVGILETVGNRFNEDLANPLHKAGASDWPGCGVGAVFATCIDPKQYRGLDTDRALRPREAVDDEELLLRAVDRAVLAWFVYEEALLGEITAGATSFVHLCGGSGYGRSHKDCEGAGADPNRGPVVFRGPSEWLRKEGRYALESLGAVDFVEGQPPTEPKAYVAYLLTSDAAAWSIPR
jgi:hypothetical protein